MFMFIKMMNGGGGIVIICFHKLTSKIVEKMALIRPPTAQRFTSRTILFLATHFLVDSGLTTIDFEYSGSVNAT